MQTKIREEWDTGKEGNTPEACQNWCLQFDNMQAKACEIRPQQCSQLSCGRLGSNDTMPSILSLCRDGFQTDPEQAGTDWQLNSPSVCPKCEARAPEPDGWHIIPQSLFTKRLFRTWNVFWWPEGPVWFGSECGRNWPRILRGPFHWVQQTSLHQG